MEKSQYNLCLEVLRRLHRAEVLQDLILIGSWCIPFYEGYFAPQPYAPAIRTRDIDFLVPSPRGIKKHANVPELLKDLGFITNFKGSKGYIKLEHPELIVEFLVPERGRGTDRPVPLPALGVNAVALRFLNFLTQNVIKVRVENFDILVPHPAHFALHKLIIFQRRSKAEKALKDQTAALEVLRALIRQGEAASIQRAFHSVSPKWQAKIIKGLDKAEDIRDLVNRGAA